MLLLYRWNFSGRVVVVRQWNVRQFGDSIFVHFLHHPQQQHKKQEEDEQGNQWIDGRLGHRFRVLFDEFEHGYLVCAVAGLLISVPKRCR